MMFKFCWHKWGRWGEAIQDFNGNLHQVCKCEKCGSIKRRCAVSMWSAQLGAEQVNSAVKESNHDLRTDRRADCTGCLHLRCGWRFA